MKRYSVEWSALNKKNDDCAEGSKNFKHVENARNFYDKFGIEDAKDSAFGENTYDASIIIYDRYTDV